MEATDIVSPRGLVQRQALAALVRRAQARIADPDHWLTGRLAADSLGTTVDPEAPQAVRWCARGALCAEVYAAAYCPLYSFPQQSALFGALNSALVGYFQPPADDPYGRAPEVLAAERLEFINDDSPDSEVPAGHTAVLAALDGLAGYIATQMPAAGGIG